MQAILGSTGVIGNELARTLYKSYTKEIRLVSRNPKQINGEDFLFQADMTDQKQAFDAVKGSVVAYLALGIQYSAKAWQEQWPKIMHNVVNACIENHTKLVFFDNVYTYGKVDGWMTEETPYNPCSKKGEIRLGVVNMMMDEVKKGNLQGMIVRAADFYGPNTPLGLMNVMVMDNYNKGKKAQWMVNPNVRHSLTYTPDAGKATAILGNTESAYNQVWHLPSDKSALTGKELIEIAAREFGVKPQYQVLNKWMLKSYGYFNRIVGEMYEMLYQYEYEYLFSSDKFEKAFDLAPTSYKEGIKETAKSYKS